MLWLLACQTPEPVEVDPWEGVPLVRWRDVDPGGPVVVELRAQGPAADLTRWSARAEPTFLRYGTETIAVAEPWWTSSESTVIEVPLVVTMLGDSLTASVGAAAVYRKEDGVATNGLLGELDLDRCPSVRASEPDSWPDELARLAPFTEVDRWLVFLPPTMPMAHAFELIRGVPGPAVPLIWRAGYQDSCSGTLDNAGLKNGRAAPPLPRRGTGLPKRAASDSVVKVKGKQPFSKVVPELSTDGPTWLRSGQGEIQILPPITATPMEGDVVGAVGLGITAMQAVGDGYVLGPWRSTTALRFAGGTVFPFESPEPLPGDCAVLFSDPAQREACRDPGRGLPLLPLAIGAVCPRARTPAQWKDALSGVRGMTNLDRLDVSVPRDVPVAHVIALGLAVEVPLTVYTHDPNRTPPAPPHCLGENGQWGFPADDAGFGLEKARRVGEVLRGPTRLINR